MTSWVGDMRKADAEEQRDAVRRWLGNYKPDAIGRPPVTRTPAESAAIASTFGELRRFSARLAARERARRIKDGTASISDLRAAAPFRDA